jgi:hypothetical protein
MENIERAELVTELVNELEERIELESLTLDVISQELNELLEKIKVIEERAKELGDK